jgi:hypothetical protein
MGRETETWHPTQGTKSAFLVIGAEVRMTGRTAIAVRMSSGRGRRYADRAIDKAVR